jgi:hypothetical protein
MVQSYMMILFLWLPTALEVKTQILDLAYQAPPAYLFSLIAQCSYVHSQLFSKQSLHHRVLPSL